MGEQQLSGTIGERIAARELAAMGWEVEFLRRNYPNSDLRIQKAGVELFIQVKAKKQNTMDWINLGKCTALNRHRGLSSIIRNLNQFLSLIGPLSLANGS